MSKKAKVFLATGAVAAIGGLVTSAFISSCDTVCSTESRASVVVNVVDGSGNPIGADSVTFTIADDPAPRDSTAGPPVSGSAAECADEDCTEWIAGYETEGLFVITAEVCGRTVQGRANVEMTEDGCHVDTEYLVLEADTLNCERPRSVDLSEVGIAFPVPEEGLDITAPEPQLCTREARPSAIVRMTSGEASNARPVTPYGVYYQIDSGPLMSGTCLDEACHEVATGWEETGTFSIYAIFDERLFEASTVVGMTEDGCHVETEDVDIRIGPTIHGVPVQKGPFLTAAPRECSYEARPSVVLEIVDGEGELAKHVPAKSVWYEMKEIREPTRAMCVHEPCGSWIVGIEEIGILDIYADVCGEIISTQVKVERTEDGCHAKTEYAKMIAPTEGCPK